MRGPAGEQVEGYVVAGEEAVVAVNLAVDALGQFGVEFLLGQVTQFVYPRVDTGCGVVMNMTLLPFNACLHVHEVVLLRLLPCRVVATLLELLGLQVVARVVLITDGEGYDVECLDGLHGAFGVAHGHHLQE